MPYGIIKRYSDFFFKLKLAQSLRARHGMICDLDIGVSDPN